VFTVRDPAGGALAATLSEVNELGTSLSDGLRAPFSVTFVGPSEPVLSQRIYVIGHEALGALELFLVPIGPYGQGMRYEAVFG
jgi:hypothetical protein